MEPLSLLLPQMQILSLYEKAALKKRLNVREEKAMITI
jgi:hypothetical protein